ncbi:hypothetical protein SNE40_007915 [Patella caerulea]|uniref:ZMYM2-like/QRICH1 C-terminal domain-containing protein n=1 Tax=Patella caerulea TaxID=87958 RepID=A0AAN8K089_PATCE
MLWGDVELKLDSDGLTECLEFTERVSKTRQGYNSKNVRQITPKMWANSQNKDHCPVELFKLSKSLRPHNFSNPENPFYISCTTVPNPDIGSVWFKRQLVGIHKLENLMNQRQQEFQKTENLPITVLDLVQKLNDSDVPPSHIMQISGHKNVQSINNYSHINDNQHKKISSILSGAECNYNQRPPPTSTVVSSSSLLSSQSTGNKNSSSNKRDHL